VTRRWLGRVRSRIRRVVCGERPAPAPSDTIVTKAAWIMAGNQIAGDYLEFGVFRGVSFAAAYHALRGVFETAGSDHMVEVGHHSQADAAAIRRIWASLRFFAFDSFAGLPKPAGVDTASPLFKEGKYACSLEEFRNNLRRAGVPSDRVVAVPGWFEETCTPAIRDRHQMQRAGIVFVDCDLYESTTQVLEFITPLLQSGTVIVFDDWYHFSASAGHGEQRAFAEWSRRLPQWQFAEYHKEGAFRTSFIVQAVAE
jgi:O-methyltransferase